MRVQLNRFTSKEFVIFQVVVYGVLILTLVALTLLLVGILSLLTGILFSTNNPNILVGISVLVIALVVVPQRKRIRLSLEGLMNKERMLYRVALPKMANDLSRSINGESYLERMTKELPGRLNIKKAALYLLDAQGLNYFCSGERHVRGISNDHPLVISLKTHNAPIVRQQLREQNFDSVYKWLEEAQFEVCLPIVVGEELIAIYNLGMKNSGHSYREDEVDLLNRYAAQAAFGVYHHQQLLAERELRQRAEELADVMQSELAETSKRSEHLQAINAIIAVAAAAPDLPHLLCSTLDLIMEALNQEAGGLFVSGYLENKGIPEVFLRYCFQATQSLGWIGSSTIIINDWNTVEDDTLKDWISQMLGAGLRSTLIVPVVVSGNHSGVLTLSSQRPNDWHEEDIALVKAVVRQVSSTMERLDLLTTTQEQARQVQRIVDTVPDGVLLLDSQQQIVLANPAARKHLVHLVGEERPEKPLEDFAGSSVGEILANSPSQPWAEIVCDKMPSRIYEIAARPVYDKPRSTGWVVVLRDVTLEREIQSQIQMQERLATVGQMAAGIAHDFNNIMAAIQVYVDLFSMDNGISDPGKERLDIVKNQIDRATSLIRQILDFSRRSVMDQSPMDLLPFVKEQEKLLQRLLPENIRVELQYNAGDYMVMADPTRLQQMFLNLALNSRDAMPFGGKLEFSMSMFQLYPGSKLPFPDIEPGDWIRISIRDTGTGIPETVLPHIFDPFFTTKESGQGTGLGLAQVYGIVKGHDGYIDLKSEEGVGSEFIIYLPQLGAEEVEPVEEFQVEKSRGAGQTVLIAEDDPITRDAVSVLLESLNYKVLAASNGKEAVKIFGKKRQDIDLLVCDLVMPEMDGIPLYETIRGNGSGQDLKCLFISGHPMDPDELEMVDGGQVDWLQKPFSVQEFATAVSKLLT